MKLVREHGAPARFLVVTEDGNLQCWAETGSRLAQRMRSFTVAVKASLGRANYLYFTAGPNGEADGLFGSLHFVDK